MMQTNNPVTFVYNKMQKGVDIITALDQAAEQYPQAFPQIKVAQAKALLGGNCKNNLEQIVLNMAKERGVTVENVLKYIGVQISN